MSTEQNGPEQHTEPIRRPRGQRDDEPTQVVETVGATAAPGTPPTTPLPVTGTPPTAPLRGGAAEPPPRPAPGVPTAAGATALGAGSGTGAGTGAGPASSGAAGPVTGTVTSPVATAQDDAAARPRDDVAGAAETVPTVSRTLRVGTVVWGLVVAIIGAGLVAVAAGARFDLELVLIGLLALAGVCLVAGSMAVSLRRRR